MKNWTAGYVADIDYTYGYYTELNPLKVRLAFLREGLVFPEIGTACELGFGQGLSANMHAAASTVEWCGTDFNPSQASFAQELSEVSGAGARLYDEAFAEFAARQDLPDFDYICLHGIFSWISDENRRVIVDFIRRKLKVGGVLYISYNTLPGWATFAPLRHLMLEHAEVMGSEGGGIVSRIDGALGFAEKMLETNPSFSKHNPLAGDRLKKLKDQNRQYLAHEYFNRDWHPMHFATMGDWLEDAKVQFACSAHLMDHIDVVNLTPEQQNFLKEIPNPMFRQSVRDFMVNQVFRRDYWVKGARKLNVLDQIDQLKEQKIILNSYRPDVSLTVSGSLGESTLSKAVYDPILDMMADHQPRTMDEMGRTLKDRGIAFAQLLQAVIILSSVGHLALVQEDSVIAKARGQTDKLNAHLRRRARYSDDIGHMASPVIGGGIGVNRFDQIFLSSTIEGKQQPAELAQDVWQIFASQGRKLIKEGNVLQTPEENLAELTQQARDFQDKKLPVMKALQII